jgi:DNA-binding MarR family transcriptional regulator
VPEKTPADLATTGGLPPALANRLGYLLKHAQMRLADLTGSALAPLGVNGRECAVLIAIDDHVPISQQEVARRLEVDRTTMVALIDELERKGLAQRRQDPDDRRKNVVELPDMGHDTLRRAVLAGDRAERRFLGSLSDAETARFKETLRSIVFR